MAKKMMATFLLAALPMAGAADQLSLGVQYDGWDSSTTLPAIQGWEIMEPLSLSLHLNKDIKIYGQSAFASGEYDDPYDGNLNINYFTDTIVGGEFKFKTFSTPSLLNVGINIPTGNSSWEAQQESWIVPVEFIDSRYRGRGFGISTLYGLDFPLGGGGEFGAAGGYLYSGAFNPSYGLTYTSDTSLKLGDSFFLSLNYLQHFSDNQTQVIRLSGFYFLATQQDGSNSFQMGPNVNASYAWNNPQGFSFEVGGSYYGFAQRLEGSQNNQQFTTEPYYSFGPRFYLDPSFAFTKDLLLEGVVKYVMPNGYPNNLAYSAQYDGGGWVFGLQPTYRLWLDGGSFIKFTGGYDDVIAINGNGNGSNANLYYYYWNFGTSYEVKL